MHLGADDIFRDNVIKGDPTSPEYKPEKPLIRRYLKTREQMASIGAVSRKTTALLNAVTPASGTFPLGYVTADPTKANNGVYTWTGSAWEKDRPFSDTMAVLTNMAGSANAVTASTAPGVDPANVVVLLAQPIATNTGNVTLSVNGEAPKPVRDVNGEELAAGLWTAGRIVQLVDNGDEYRLVSDPSADGAAASAADSAAQSQTFRDQAESFASTAMAAGNASNIFDTLAYAAAYNPDTAPAWLQVQGYTTAGDIPAPMIFQRVDAEPAGNAKLQIADGTWYRLQQTVYNVLEYGARRTTAFDSTAAFQAAINSVPDGLEYTSTIYAPAGDYLVTATLTSTGKNIAFMGDGDGLTRLNLGGSTAPYAIDINGAGVPTPNCGIRDMSIRQNGWQDQATLVRIRNSENYFLRDLFLTCSGGLIDVGEGSNMASLSNIRGEAYGAKPALRHRGGGGAWTNLFIRKFSTRGDSGPCLLIAGTQTTSLQVSNSSLGGKGSTNKVAVSQITSTSTTFTVTVPSGHGFLAASWVRIAGVGNGYDNLWLVASVTATTIVIASTINLGTVTPAAATLASPRATVQIDNQYGPANEITFTGVLFEGIDDGGTAGGDAAVVLDASRGNSSLNDIQFGSCFFDSGKIGLAAFGKHETAEASYINGLKVTGSAFKGTRAAVYSRETRGLLIADNDTYCLKSVEDFSQSAAIWINDLGANASRGHIITGNRLGRSPDMRNDTLSQRSYHVGVRLHGTPTVLTFVGNQIFGTDTAVEFLQSEGGSDYAHPETILEWAGNTVMQGGSESMSTRIPTIASAASIALRQPRDKVKLSGTTAITSILGGWVGREVQFICEGAITIGPGSNIANAVSAVAGQLVIGVFDGSSWHLR